MKKPSKPKEPSKASLREIPEVDFDKATVRRNPHVPQEAKRRAAAQSVGDLLDAARADGLGLSGAKEAGLALRATHPVRRLLPFDAARYLTNDAAVVEFMNAALETGDADLLLMALGDIARARGMVQLAKDTGLGRESLYKALAPGAKPRCDTVLKIARALGVKLTAAPR